MKNPFQQYIIPFLYLCFSTTTVEGNSNKQHHQRKASSSSSEESSSRKPNIMIVLADDVGTGEVPGYWNTGLVDMPHLQQLVNDGTVFTDAHSTPLCAPSRYMLLSGNYPHRGNRHKGTWAMNFVSGQFREEQLSVADEMRANGYHTGMFGKYHLGGKVPTMKWYDPKGRMKIKRKDTMLTMKELDWNEPVGGGPQDIGFDTSYVTASGIQGPPYTFMKDGIMQGMSNLTFWEKGTYNMPEGKSIIQTEGDGSGTWDSTAYNMILVNETEKFLDDHIENRNNDPFFAYVALGSVHTPHSAPTSFLDGTPVAGEYPTPHMDALLEMDKVVGSLKRLLRDRNMEDDTIIVFASDNGGLLKKGSNVYGHNSHGPLRGSKGTIYEGGHRIPFIMQWKNGVVPSGETRSRLIGLSDLYATLCDLVGINVSAGQAIDSISFADYIEKEEKQDNLREYHGVWSVDPIKLSFQFESIRKGNLKLIRNRQNGESFLYDLDNDISESESLISDSIYNDVVEEMIFKLEEISPCYDNPGSLFIENEEGERIETSCAWFAQDTRRCHKYAVGHNECRLTCVGEPLSCRFSSITPATRAPTVAPTSSSRPTSTLEPSSKPSAIPCSDAKTVFEFVRWEGGVLHRKDCNWVKKYPRVRCQRFKEVRENCPVTCGFCLADQLSNSDVTATSESSENTCSDVNVNFEVERLDKRFIWVRNCDWVKTVPKGRCKRYHEAREKCPVTCRLC